MAKVIKLFIPILFLVFYSITSYFIYYGVDDSVFSIKDTIQIVTGNFILIMLLLLYARFVCGSQWGEMFNTKLRLKEVVIVLLMIPGIEFSLDRIVISFMDYFHYSYTPVIRDLGEFKIFLFDALFAVLIAPLLEELIFRFCIISLYHSLVGKLFGMIVGSVLFGYMHSTVSARLSAMFMGIILGLVYLMTDDLVVCILFHAGVNLLITICACVSSYIQNEDMISFVSSVIYVNVPILLISVSISLIGAVILYKKY